MGRQQRLTTLPPTPDALAELARPLGVTTHPIRYETAEASYLDSPTADLTGSSTCAFTGLFGLKPSFGRVPASPLSPFGTISHLGPMTRTVADAALMMNVLALPDARDWHALPYHARDYRVELEDGVRGLRTAYSPRLGHAEVDPEVAALVKAAVQVFEGLGAYVDEVDPGFEDQLEVFTPHWCTGAAYAVRAVPES